MTKLSALVFGATGLVGKKVLEVLQNDNRYDIINVANRSNQGYNYSKVNERLVDFKNLEDSADLFKVDHVFVCLGTTINKAGSKSKFEKVDLIYPSKIAELSKINNISALIHISCLGADSSSNNFYLKTKGRAEVAVINLGPKKSVAVRPSMLYGKRNEFRLGENIGKVLMKGLGFLMIGPLKKYKGIYDLEVANAMVEIANYKTAKNFYNSNELSVISKDKVEP